MPTPSDNTDVALEAERDDWQSQIGVVQTQLDTAQTNIATLTAQVGDLTTQLAACEASKPPVGQSKRLSLSAIQTFPHRLDLPTYTNFPAVFKALAELGIKRIRGQVGPGTSATAMGFYKTAWDTYGIKSLLTVGEPRVVLTAAQWTSIEQKLVTLGSAAIDSLYGWNEPNSVRGGGTPLPADWAVTTANHQKKLAALGTKLGVLVGTCALWSGDPAATWLDMAKVKAAGQTSAHYDIIAYHQYPRDNDTQAEVDAFYSKTETELRRVLADADSPFACTEWGYSTAPNAGTSGAVRLTEAERARRIQLVAGYHVSHNNRHSLFELWNTADPTGADREDWLGLVWVDGTRTPGFVSYKTFLAA